MTRETLMMDLAGLEQQRAKAAEQHALAVRTIERCEGAIQYVTHQLERLRKQEEAAPEPVPETPA